MDPNLEKYSEMRTTDKVIQKNKKQNKTKQIKNPKSDIRLQNGGQKPKFKLVT